MKRILTFILLLSLSVMFGCSFLAQTPTLTLDAPDAGYPPFAAQLVAGGMSGGQYIFEVEGETYQQPENSLAVVIHTLPCEVKVTWLGDGGPKLVTKTIGLRNAGPIIGRPELNGIDNLWTIHPRGKYTVTFPYVRDNEGGPTTLINATIWNSGQGEPNTVFCPPYTGVNPPEIDLYRVRTDQGDVENAFIFWSIWNGPIECGSQLPWTPPSQSAAGYPHSPFNCNPSWTQDLIPGGMTIITATFEDEMGATTTESWEIPTIVYPGCD